MSEENIIPLPVERSSRELRDRDDDELMRLSSAGNRAAFAALVARHMGGVMGFCTKMLGDRRGGEDMAQETWLEVWAHREGYRPSGKFVSFLFTVARNRCRNALRSARRRGRVVSDLVPVDDRTASDQPDHLDALLRSERRKRVYDGIATLSPKLREALLLRFSQELDYAEIAAIVGRSESTVRSRVHHGLRKLRQHLGEESK